MLIFQFDVSVQINVESDIYMYMHVKCLTARELVRGL